MTIKRIADLNIEGLAVEEFLDEQDVYEVSEYAEKHGFDMPVLLSYQLIQMHLRSDFDEFDSDQPELYDSQLANLLDAAKAHMDKSFAGTFGAIEFPVTSDLCEATIDDYYELLVIDVSGDNDSEPYVTIYLAGQI